MCFPVGTILMGYLLLSGGRILQRHQGMVLGAVAAVVAAVAVLSFPMASDASSAQPGCVTAKCHATMGKDKYVHGPVAVGECTFCHQVAGEHKFSSIGDVGGLCNECHDKFDSGNVIHAPVKEGRCTACHDPHQSPNRFQLRGAGADLCFLCHDRGMVGGKYVHSPVEGDSCSTCHQVHQSEFPKMLFAQGNDVCFECHADKLEAFKGRKFTHAPVADACVNCHNPHSGSHPNNLAADGVRELCFTCHTDKAEHVAKATVKHGGLSTEKKCLACHDPHVSDFAKQLTMEPADLCLDCHDREYEKDNGKVADMKELLDKNAIHHGPIKEKDCSGCHDTHGSDNFRMLRGGFTPVFYAPYSPKNFELCFMCHEKTLASDQWTTTLTGFRNGNQNLHFVHVNKTIKGRTCRACHDAHATNNPRHIRDAVPFNAWQLPVGFAKTQNGGTCLPGCHQLFGYDREKPVANRR